MQEARERATHERYHIGGRAGPVLHLRRVSAMMLVRMRGSRSG